MTGCGFNVLLWLLLLWGKGLLLMMIMVCLFVCRCDRTFVHTTYLVSGKKIILKMILIKMA